MACPDLGVKETPQLPYCTSHLLGGLILLSSQASLGKGSRPDLALILPPAALSAGGALKVNNACDGITP